LHILGVGGPAFRFWVDPPSEPARGRWADPPLVSSGVVPGWAVALTVFWVCPSCSVVASPLLCFFSSVACDFPCVFYVSVDQLGSVFRRASAGSRPLLSPSSSALLSGPWRYGSCKPLTRVRSGCDILGADLLSSPPSPSGGGQVLGQGGWVLGVLGLGR